MDEPLCKLTLVAPPGGRDRLVELMLESDPPLPGFTTWEAEGHGFGFSEATARERVRGRVARSMIVAVLPRTRAEALIEQLGREAAIAHLTYWIEPVETFGQMR